jgi:multicomponent Na+:H+ antiporter subunit G
MSGILTSLDIRQIVIGALLTVGVFFTLVSAIGIVRLPDIYARMHAAGKASTLGVACILLAAGLHFGGWVLFRMLVLVALFLITGPIATTAMGRAAYRTDARRSLILNHDELAEVQAVPPPPGPR